MSVSSVSPTFRISTNSSNDVNQLKSQEATLRSLLEQINSSKDDEKSNETKVQVIEAKINQIQAQLKQL